MLGVAQSTFHIPVQIAFLTLTTIGVIFAIMYNSATPDFYQNNAHHKIGWVIVWMLVAQVASGMIRGVARYVNGDPRSRQLADQAEDMFMLGDDIDTDAEEDDPNDENEIKRRPDFRRKSSDSGNGTGESTPRGGSSSDEPSTPFVIRRSSENTLLDDHERNFHTVDTISPRNAESKMEKYLAKKLQKQGWLNRISRRGAFIAKVVHGVIGRPLFLLGFIQLCTGVATVTGIFKGNDIFNGLAHFIKGIALEMPGSKFRWNILQLRSYHPRTISRCLRRLWMGMEPETTRCHDRPKVERSCTVSRIRRVLFHLFVRRQSNLHGTSRQRHRNVVSQRPSTRLHCHHVLLGRSLRIAY